MLQLTVSLDKLTQRNAAVVQALAPASPPGTVIAIFAINQDSGQATRIGNEPTRGATPRNFAIDPAGRFLYVANQNSASIVRFRIDTMTGLLDSPARVAEVPAPTCIVFTRT